MLRRPGKPSLADDDAGAFSPLPTYIELEMAMAAATAYDVVDANGRPSLFPRLSLIEKAIAASIAILALYGLILIGDGLYIKAKTHLSHVLLKRAFAAELRGEDARPWPWADFTTEAKVSAPRLGKHSIVLSGNSEPSSFGPSWIAGTPQPGEEGTSVISARRHAHFLWLKDVHPGDDIEVTRGDGKVLTFKAGEGRIVPWDDSGIDPATQGKRLVLATCWPFGATERGPLRYVVEADLVDTQATGAIPQTNTKPLSHAE